MLTLPSNLKSSKGLINLLMENLIHCTCGNVILSEDQPAVSQTQIFDFEGDLDYIELFCQECADEGCGVECDEETTLRRIEREARTDAYDDYDHDDMYDVESALGSAGMGTDEYYSA